MESLEEKGGRLMDKKEARLILGAETLQADGGLSDPDWYLEYIVGTDFSTLDGTFEAKELEAIAWWMKNKKEKG